MAQKLTVVPGNGAFTIKYKDIFDMKAFYESLHEWFLEHDWGDLEDGKDKWERLYRERVAQGGAREIWIEWRLKKQPENVPFMYYLNLSFHCVALMNTEIIKDGEKLKVNKGEVELVIKPQLELSYEDAMYKYDFLKRITILFRNRMYNNMIGERKKELYQEAFVLNNFIKQWFKLKRYLPYEETKSFFPSSAWPSHLKE